MTIPRQLAPTVGLAHGGVEFLEGSLVGIEKLAIRRMEKSRQICCFVIGNMINFGAGVYKFEIKGN